TTMPVNWCTSCKCVLANEEVVEGVCERCGAPVIRKEKSQWMLGITKYAQRLLDDLDDLDYIDRVKAQQRNWIGRSTGAEVNFATTEGDVLTVFTTRCDTLFGATYMVMSPEHECVKKWEDKLENRDEVADYVRKAAAKSDFERTELTKEKTGVELKGVRAVNPVTGNEIPIFISDYVLATYGTGAIMAVPAHDQRDWEFARVFHLPIVQVVAAADGREVDLEKGAFTDVEEGVLINSGFLNGLGVKDAIATMIRWLEDKGLGREKVNFKLRDWVFSRQRYWGEPIPIIHCDKCGWVPMDEKDLPLLLPEVESYEPTDTGESPLAAMTDWVRCTCPRCGGPAEHETDTMPNWAGSSWYFLRYMDPHNDKALVGEDAVKFWKQVDWYNGGMEHTTLHLLYSRFWHKFLYDIGVVPTSEPYAKRTSHGMILGQNPRNFANLPAAEQQKLMEESGGEEGARAHLREKYGEMADHPIVKMSKSLGNVVNPDDVVREYGADTLRTYIMFIGDFAKAAPWQDDAVKGCKRFLDRIWNLCEQPREGDELSRENERDVHRAIEKVSRDIEEMKFNTAIAALMTLVNRFYQSAPSRGDVKVLLQLLSPFAPHIAEELWEIQGFGGDCCLSRWPEFDESKLHDAEKTLAVQVNGKLRSTVVVAAGCDQETALAAASADKKVAGYMEGMDVVKVIFVPDKLINLILKPRK
ncbi:MAG: leucine--tRNA ligase, partial [Oscillospiraceae bacterium]|nr:leucine--tRNA ligase [Oscillospiraceae bacterium]